MGLGALSPEPLLDVRHLGGTGLLGRKALADTLRELQTAREVPRKGPSASKRRPEPLHGSFYGVVELLEVARARSEEIAATTWPHLRESA